jgi:hypothetical protein
MALKDLPVSFVNRGSGCCCFRYCAYVRLVIDWVLVVLIGYNLNYRAKFARLTQATLSVGSEPNKACLAEAHPRGRSVM